jgi:hypothetical protein
LIELSTRHNFEYFVALGAIYRGWARSASGDIAEGIPWIEQGIRHFRATGSVHILAPHLATKAEALHLAGRTSEALEAINEAEALAERFEQRLWSAELHRLRDDRSKLTKQLKDLAQGFGPSARFIRWFFSTGSDRTIFPASDVKIAEWVDNALLTNPNVTEEWMRNALILPQSSVAAYRAGGV